VVAGARPPFQASGDAASRERRGGKTAPARVVFTFSDTRTPVAVEQGCTMLTTSPTTFATKTRMVGLAECLFSRSGTLQTALKGSHLWSLGSLYLQAYIPKQNQEVVRKALAPFVITSDSRALGGPSPQQAKDHEPRAREDRVVH